MEKDMNCELVELTPMEQASIHGGSAWCFAAGALFVIGLATWDPAAVAWGIIGYEAYC